MWPSIHNEKVDVYNRDKARDGDGVIKRKGAGSVQQQTRRTTTTKIGNHVAFSRIRQILGTSLPGAPNKSMYQLPRPGSLYCLRTESRASVKEEGKVAAAGRNGSCGALFCTCRAICAILRNEVEESFLPKETVWKESGLLASTSLGNRRGDQNLTNPWRTALRHMSKIVSSMTCPSPSDKKIMTGVLKFMSVYSVKIWPIPPE